MSKRNWAEERDNTERTIFEKGRWTLTEDGERTKSLYFDGDCVESVLMHNHYIELEGGFVVYSLEKHNNEYIAYSQKEKKPVFKIEGRDVTFKLGNNVITFYDGNTEVSLETSSMTQLELSDDNQLSFEF